jgi:predicted RNA-binding protein YlxR (DUF448 family)
VKARHRPQRSCVACRETVDQRDLVRLVHGADGLAVDETRRAPGRGAYLCRRPACWQRARETSQARGGGPLGHALRATIDDHDRSVLAAFEQTLDASGAQHADRPVPTPAAARGAESGAA